MGNGIMPILRHLRKKPVPIDQNARFLPFLHDLFLKRRPHPVFSAHHFNPVKAEKFVRLPFTGYSVITEHVPDFVVFLPVTKFHIKAPVNRAVMHLVIEALPVSHGPLPLLSVRNHRFPLFPPAERLFISGEERDRIPLACFFPPSEPVTCIISPAYESVIRFQPSRSDTIRPVPPTSGCILPFAPEVLYGFRFPPPGPPSGRSPGPRSSQVPAGG